MANLRHSRTENVSGAFYVDNTCIDCDACRSLAPQVFSRVGGQSAVFAQPTSDFVKVQALQALVACPTGSIGTETPDSDLGKVRKSFPLPLDSENIVLYNGYHSQKSFGGASYFIHRSTGNLLIDSPRDAAPLIEKFANLGGIQSLLLTHGDDVADHAVYHSRFNCARWIHRGDHGALPDAEHFIEGKENLFLVDDLQMIPVPGHTQGSCCFLFQNKYLFTGDHLAFSSRLGHLYAFRDACWYSWSEQIQSMEKLLDFSFEWVLPGHGRKYHGTPENIRDNLKQCIAWMKTK